MHNNALDDLSETEIVAACFVGTGCFLIRYSKDHTK